MSIAVKRIYEAPSASDGQRILVDRLWPRGISKDKAQLALWLKEIAPSNALRQWYHADMTQKDEFERRYRLELDANPEAVAILRDRIKDGPVTLMFSSQDLERNHARFLARFLLEG